MDMIIENILCFYQSVCEYLFFFIQFCCHSMSSRSVRFGPRISETEKALPESTGAVLRESSVLQ